MIFNKTKILGYCKNQNKLLVECLVCKSIFFVTLFFLVLNGKYYITLIILKIDNHWNNTIFIKINIILNLYVFIENLMELGYDICK